MKFFAFKEFRGLASDMVAYLREDLKKTLKELQIGLTRLSFLDNFVSFEVEVTIPAGDELAIRNELRTRIPDQRLIVRGNDNSPYIVDGDTEWTMDYVYLKNTGAGTATATVVFLG